MKQDLDDTIKLYSKKLRNTLIQFVIIVFILIGLPLLASDDTIKQEYKAADSINKDLCEATTNLSLLFGLYVGWTVTRVWDFFIIIRRLINIGKTK